MNKLNMIFSASYRWILVLLCDINNDALSHIGDVWEALNKDRKTKNNKTTKGCVGMCEIKEVV